MSQGPAPQMSSPTKDVNTASLCSVGQQAVQDLVHKTQEMFKFLKDLQVRYLLVGVHLTFGRCFFHFYAVLEKNWLGHPFGIDWRLPSERPLIHYCSGEHNQFMILSNPPIN